MRTHSNRKSPAAASALAPPRPFASPGAAAPAQRAAAPGHDFGRMAVSHEPPARGANHTGLPDGLKAGIERLSGLPMDDVRVHYGSRLPARLDARAYARGTHIHVAPGQERHLPHEAWHVVQQKQGRVRATTRLRGTPLNASDTLEREAETMGARARLTRPARVHDAPAAAPATAHAPAAPAAAAPASEGAVVQPVLEGLRKWWRGEKEPLLPTTHKDYEKRVYSGYDEEEARRRNDEHAVAAASSALPEDASLAATGLSVGASATAKTADAAKLLSLTGGGNPVSGWGGFVGSGITTIGSTIDAGVQAHDLLTGGRQKLDKAEKGSEVISSLGNATANAALATQTGAAVLGHPVSSAVTSTLGHVAAPAAIASGAADIVGGGFTAHRAGKRQAALEGIASQEGFSFDKGLAEFAAEQQKTKKNANWARVAKGALAVGGGVALAVGGLSNPIGWGLLGGAAAIGGGAALYKKYREYQQGQRILTDDSYRTRLGLSDVQLPDRRALDQQWLPKRLYNTAKVHETTRGHVANQLTEEGSILDTPERAAIRENIGIGAKEYDYRPQGEKRKKRARQIARALAP